MSQSGFPRIVQRSVTNGTGPYELLPSRETSFGLFRDRLQDGDRVVVMIVNPGKQQEWQECLCRFTEGSPDTLTVLGVITSSAVADAAVEFTAGSKYVMLCEPSYSLRAAEKLRPAIDVAVITNQTLASVTAGATLDSRVLQIGDRVGLFGQTTATQIGVYQVTAGAPIRCTDMLAGDTVSGAMVPVRDGTYQGGWAFCVSEAGSDIVGTSSLIWTLTTGTPKASTVINDSSVSGTTVKDALDTLQGEIDDIVEEISLLPGGNVTADAPTTVGDIPYWSTTARKLSSTSPLAVHTASSNKVETKVGSFRAYNTAVDGATVSFDLDLADLWEVTLGGNRTLQYTHASKGQIIAVRLIQDATGSRTVTWWANIKWHHSLAPVLDPTPGGSDLILLECVGQDAYAVPVWEEVCRKSSAPRKGIYSNTDGATITFDLRKSPKHKVTLGGARTLALVESHVGQVFEVTLVQDGTGSRTVTWWAGISWAGGSAPTLSTAAGKADVFGFIETASGSYYGFVIGQGI